MVGPVGLDHGVKGELEDGGLPGIVWTDENLVAVINGECEPLPKGAITRLSIVQLYRHVRFRQLKTNESETESIDYGGLGARGGPRTGDGREPARRTRRPKAGA